jgi:hypothetical protein
MVFRLHEGLATLFEISGLLTDMLPVPQVLLSNSEEAFAQMMEHVHGESAYYFTEEVTEDPEYDYIRFTTVCSLL